MVLVLLPETWLLLRDGKASNQHPDRRAVGGTELTIPNAQGEAQGQARSPMARQSRVLGRDHLGASVGRAVERPAATVSERGHVLAPPSRLGGARDLANSMGSASRRARRERPARLAGDVHGRDLPSREKRGDGIGLTKRGKGTKVEVIVSREGIPLAAVSAPANVGETKLVEPVLQQMLDSGDKDFWPTIIVADKAYDSDPLREVVASVDITLLAPHRRNRRPEKCTNDGRMMRRYRNRWRVERTFAHAGNYRRFTTRYERLLTTANAVVNAVCVLLTLTHL
jgi:transposase